MAVLIIMLRIFLKNNVAYSQNIFRMIFSITLDIFGIRKTFWRRIILNIFSENLRKKSGKFHALLLKFFVRTYLRKFYEYTPRIIWIS